MRNTLLFLLATAAFGIAGCVDVDLGQASKDWSEVGKSFADGYKQPAQQQQQPVTGAAGSNP